MKQIDIIFEAQRLNAQAEEKAIKHGFFCLVKVVRCLTNTARLVAARGLITDAEQHLGEAKELVSFWSSITEAIKTKGNIDTKYAPKRLLLWLDEAGIGYRKGRRGQVGLIFFE